MSETARQIIAQLTLQEKCELCAQADGSFGRVERLGKPGSVPQDNPRGGADYFRSGRAKEGDGEYHPVALPSDACLAMSWDEEAAYRAGEIFALECRANPTLVNWLFRPGVNIKRSPLCGRNFEYFSEDPVLSGEMAGSFVQGLQANGVAATLKHFLCNNQEFERMTTNAVVSERALREVYLRAFEIAIGKGAPLSIMSSYNRVNGEWVNSNGHICDLLRKELGYDGVVVSDFAAVHHNKIEAHRCGMMDIELAPTGVHSEELMQAVEEGSLQEDCIDRSLERVFDLVEKLYETKPARVDMESLHKEARAMAAQCMVLLKNEDILPLTKGQEDLLVIGALAEDPSYMGGGSGHMNGWKVDTYLEMLRRVEPEVRYCPGYVLREGWPPAEPVSQKLIDEAVQAAEKAGTVIVFAGLGYCYESEGYDRADIRLPEGQRRLLDELVRVHDRIILVLSCASVLDISPWNDKVRAVLYNSLGGEAVAGATVDVLYGAAQPEGHLAETWPVCEEHTPSYTNFTHAGEDMADVVYGEDIYVGYRWYEKRSLPVLYPFGHGLSYTTFEVGRPVLSALDMTPEDTLKVTVPVTNTGNRAGRAVVQLYLSYPDGSICDHPPKELKAFAGVCLAPGETKEAVLVLDRRALEFYAPSRNRWIVEDGRYALSIGTSSADICFRETVAIHGGDVPIVYTQMTPLAWFVCSEKYHRILAEDFPPHLQQMMKQNSFDWLCLCLPLPFYKLTEGYLGEPMITKEEMEHILNRMNER